MGRQTKSTLRLALLAAAGLAFAAPAAAETVPRRVVSINVCTDQLAMLIASEGQLHAVSALARDPNSSAMPEEAQAFAVTHGLAEEIFLMEPDLVLAGTFSARPTVGILRRLGIRVEEFRPARSFDDIRANILRIGELLHRQEAEVEEISRRLSAFVLAADSAPSRALLV